MIRINCYACGEKSVMQILFEGGGEQFLFAPCHSCGAIIKRWILSKCILECINDYAWFLINW